MLSWTFRPFLAMLLMLGIGACKTSDKKIDGNNSSGRYGGKFDSAGRVNVKVPEDLRNFKPHSGITTNAESTPNIGGLSLNDPPVSTKGIEQILTTCFTHDSQFIADGWYFYTQLLSNGSVIKSFHHTGVDKCNEMQLVLKTLEKNTIYEVVASFFWKSDDQKTTIVWYEGKTKPFKPSDQNITLILEKLRIDQVVDVDVEKSEKDRCLYQQHLWNGLRCLDSYNALSFSQSDLSDYAQSNEAEGSRNRKCLEIGDQGIAAQYDCHYQPSQRILTKLHGTQKLGSDVPPSEYGWFSLQFDGGNYCLQAQRDPKGGDPYLLRMECDTNVPKADQLFTLIETTSGDSGGRNSFRIMNQSDGTARCISVPPEEGDTTGVASLRNGAPVRLTSCTTSNPNTRKSQFIKFVDLTD